MTDPITRLGHSLVARVGRGVRALPRPSAGWLAVRLLAWGLGAAVLLLPVPSYLYGVGPFVVAVLLAVVAAALPGTVAVMLVELVAVGAWLFSTWLLGEPVASFRVLAFAVTLYLHHVVCAYAAVLPVAAAFTPALLVRALSRTGVVSAASVVLGVGVFAVAGWLAVDSPLAAPLAGIAAALGTAGLLVHLLHRRPADPAG